MYLWEENTVRMVAYASYCSCSTLTFSTRSRKTSAENSSPQFLDSSVMISDLYWLISCWQMKRKSHKFCLLSNQLGFHKIQLLHSTIPFQLLLSKQCHYRTPNILQFNCFHCIVYISISVTQITLFVWYWHDIKLCHYDIDMK